MIAIKIWIHQHNQWNQLLSALKTIQNKKITMNQSTQKEKAQQIIDDLFLKSQIQHLKKKFLSALINKKIFL